MFLKQYYLECLAHASYMIADETTKVAVVVDPRRDTDLYVAEAEERGFTIRHVFLTHFHADFVAGHIELRDRVGARIHLGARADATYDFTPAHDGDVLELGSVRIEALETPGHTPEGISLVVYDLEKSESPHAVLTGDTLFIGDVGRPDLMASVGVTAEELAGSLYDSLHEKLMKLPDETLVYPAHGAGSMCGKNLSTDTVSTIGRQREGNYALQPMTKEAFVRMSTTGLAPAPSYFSYDATLNKIERGSLEEHMESLTALSLSDVRRAIADGDQVIDTREPGEFATEHIRGSVNVPLDGKFATWSGTLLSPETSLIIVAPIGHEKEAAMRLGRIGFQQVAGYLDGGIASANGSEDLLAETERVRSEDLAGRLASESPPLLLDVRTPGEWETERVPESLNIPLDQLQDRLTEVPRSQAVVTMCRTGIRSSIAASLLARAGFTNVIDQVGGIHAWKDAGDACNTIGAAASCSDS